MENKSTKYIKSAFSILCKVEQTFQSGVTKGHKKHAMKEGGKFPGEVVPSLGELMRCTRD